MGLIQCTNVSKSFGEKVALDHVSVDIPKGKIFGLLGPTVPERRPLSESSTGSPFQTRALSSSMAVLSLRRTSRRSDICRKSAVFTAR